MIQKELLLLLPQLIAVSENEKVFKLLQIVKNKEAENIF
jgi:hypothetical protein